MHGLGLAESALTAAGSRANSVGVGKGGQNEGVYEQNRGGEDQQGAFHGVFSPCVGGDNSGIMTRDVHLRSELPRDSACSQFVTRPVEKMTLKSALQDFWDTTLAAVTGLLGKLRYISSLRGGSQRYNHWGMGVVHGEEASDRALRAAHGELFRRVLRTPMADLLDDLHDSNAGAGVPPDAYVQEVWQGSEQLIPVRSDAASTGHFKAVMMALSSLARAQAGPTRSSAWRSQPPVPGPPRPEDGEARGLAPGKEGGVGE